MIGWAQALGTRASTRPATPPSGFVGRHALWVPQAPALSDPPVRIRRTQFATLTNERHWGNSTLVVGMVES